jgi:LCP family protein required for cell wall assembly
MPDDGEQGRGEQGRPDYKVYRSRPRLLDRLRSPDVDSLRERPREPGERPSPRAPLPSPGRRRWLRWVLIAIGGWLLLSVVVFAISAQIQQAKLADGAKEEIGGNPFLAIDPQTILVIGTDAREEGTLDGSETSEECLEEGANGEPPSETCPGFRADTLMLVRAGGGAFRKLSIPRDSFAEIPGQSAQKINAAYAFGGAALQIQTVEAFLDTEIDHVVIVDFEGFEDFIDAIGGVEVELPDKLCSEISGGAEAGGFTLNVGPGETTLGGNEALILARTRTNNCPEQGGSTEFDSYDDIDRAAAQQEILSGIKGRLTSPLRLPYNFIKGPWIGWTAPKALVTDMGAFTMPQLVLASIVGGDSGTEILKPSAEIGPGGSLVIPEEERRAAVEKLIEG